jgi:hypothetical protein
LERQLDQTLRLYHRQSNLLLATRTSVAQHGELIESLLRDLNFTIQDFGQRLCRCGEGGDTEPEWPPLTAEDLESPELPTPPIMEEGALEAAHAAHHAAISEEVTALVNADIDRAESVSFNSSILLIPY